MKNDRRCIFCNGYIDDYIQKSVCGKCLKRCVNCNKNLPGEDDMVCIWLPLKHCGDILTEDYIRYPCEQCGKDRGRGTRYCAECGPKVNRRNARDRGTPDKVERILKPELKSCKKDNKLVKV